jgi:hypothetical protein
MDTPVTTKDSFPELIVYPDGSSGIEIRAVLDKSYNCVEFTTKVDRPQTILISPWMQFEPAEMTSKRLAYANEIVRRANAYEGLVKNLGDEQRTCKHGRETLGLYREQIMEMFDIWIEERKRHGLREDFKDVNFKKRIF